MKTNLSQKNDTVVKAPRAGKDNFFAVYLNKTYLFSILIFRAITVFSIFIPGRQSTEATKNNFFHSLFCHCCCTADFCFDENFQAIAGNFEDGFLCLLDKKSSFISRKISPITISRNILKARSH